MLSSFRVYAIVDLHRFLLFKICELSSILWGNNELIFSFVLHGFVFRIILLLSCPPFKAVEPSLVCYLIYSWRGDNWVHALFWFWPINSVNSYLFIFVSLYLRTISQNWSLKTEHLYIFRCKLYFPHISFTSDFICENSINKNIIRLKKFFLATKNVIYYFLEFTWHLNLSDIYDINYQQWK